LGSFCGKWNFSALAEFRAAAEIILPFIASVSVTPVAFASLCSGGWQMKTYDRTDDIIAALIFLGVGVLTVYAALNLM
jgi:hypothetical protein